MDWNRTGQQFPCPGASNDRSGVVVYGLAHNRTSTAIIGGAFMSPENYRASFAGRVVFANFVGGGVYAATSDFRSVRWIGLSEGVSKIKVGPDGRIWLINFRDERIQEVYDVQFPPPDLSEAVQPGRCPVPAGGPFVPSIANTVYEEEMPASAIQLRWRCLRNTGTPRVRCARDGTMTRVAGQTRPMVLAGRRFSFGFGVRGLSVISIPLQGKCGSFSTGFGLDDTSLMSSMPSVEFNISVDGLVVAQRVSGRNAVQYQRNISLVGAQTLTLRTRLIRGGYHNAIWAEPTLYCGPDSPFLPRVSIQPVGFDGLSAVPGSTVAISGRAVDRLGFRIPASGFEWQLNLYHCKGSRCHSHPMQIVVSGTETASFALMEHEDCIWYEIQLTAKDACGRPGTARQSLLVQSLAAMCAGSGTSGGRLGSLNSSLIPDGEDPGEWAQTN